MAASAGVQIDDPTGEAIVFADGRRLLQVMTNLLSNAIKYSPRDSRVGITVESIGQNAVVRVSDQGPGIPADQQTLIFDRFRQSRTVSNLAMKSTGLGLAIVKAIVEAHRGTVGVESEDGKGSTFWFKLPLKEGTP
jgi:signal transduction histidine kinase